MAFQIQRAASKKNRITVTLMMVFTLVVQPLYGAANSHTAHALSPSSVVTTNLSNWDLSETKSAGHNALVAGGLRIWTDNATGNAKAAGYYATNFSLSELGNKSIAESIDYQITSGIAPGLQLKTDFDGNGSIDGILVGESVYGNNWWLSNSAAGSVKNNAPHMGSGHGSQWYGTSNEWSAKFVNAKVKAVGYSLGSGVHADGIIKRISLGNTDYTFNKLSLLAPTNLGPANNSHTSNASFNNTWSKVEGAAKYEYIAKYTVNGSEHTYTDTSDAGNYELGSSTIVRHNSGAPESTYAWKVRALESDGTPGPWSVEHKVTVDTIKPTVPTGGTPHSSSVLTNDFYFTWNASADAQPVKYEFQSSGSNTVDGNGSLVSAWNSITNGDSEQNNLTTPKIHSKGATDGTYYWQVRAFDAAGNKSAWSPIWTMKIDSVAPSLSVTSPVDLQLFGGASLMLNVNAAASDSNGLGAYYVALNSIGKKYVYQPANGTMQTAAIDLTGLGDGQHTVLVRVTDKSGNATQVTRKIVIDNTAPVISTSITEGQTLSGTAAIDLSTVEAHPKIYSIRILDTAGNVVMVDGVAQGKYDANNPSNSFVYDWDTTKVANGTYKVQFSARDALGNGAVTIFRTVAVNNVPVVPDPVKPVVFINVAMNGQTVSGTVDMSPESFQVYIDGDARNDVVVTNDGQDSDGKFMWSFMMPGEFADGEEHAIRVVVTAGHGQSSDDTKAFIVPTVPTPPAGGGSTNPNENASTGTIPSSDNFLLTEIARLSAPFVVSNSFSTFIAPQTPPASDDTAVLGAQTAKDPSADQNAKTVAVAATESGWKLFGILWYWWLLLLAVLGYITYRIAARRPTAQDV